MLGLLLRLFLLLSGGCVFQVRGSIVVSISARHAEDPGSIPGRGVLRCGAVARCCLIMFHVVCAVSIWRHARLAQPVERKALNLVVVGSSPTVGAFRNQLEYTHFNDTNAHALAHAHTLPTRKR